MERVRLRNPLLPGGLALALGFYSQRGVSLGYCAQIARMGKASLVCFLGDNGASIFRFDSDEEFLDELANA